MPQNMKLSDRFRTVFESAVLCKLFSVPYWAGNTKRWMAKSCDDQDFCPKNWTNSPKPFGSKSVEMKILLCKSCQVKVIYSLARSLNFRLSLNLELPFLF